MTDKEIIQALRICATHKEKGCGLCPQRKYVRCTERLADEAITMIERLTAENAALREKVPEWVNVASRLPEVWKNERTGYLVNYIVYNPYSGADIGNYHKETGNWLCMGLPCTVTHWMPLPEAPEEGEKA